METNDTSPSSGEGTGETPAMSPPSSTVLQQAIYALEPIVRLLLEHGVTYPQLADALKGTFLEAVQRSRSGGLGRMTDSELAVRTGIHRKDVRRLRDGTVKAAPRETRPSLTSVVVTRWLSDRQYCNDTGQPAKLARGSDGARSFDALVKSVSTDVHPRAVFNELVRLNLIAVDDDSVGLKVDAFVPNADLASMLEYLGANLHDHAAAAVQNVLKSGPTFVEQSIFSDGVRAAGVDELATLARQHWTHVLQTFVPQVARHEPSETDKAATPSQAEPTARMRFGMYFYAESEQSTAQHDPKDSNRRKT